MRVRSLFSNILIGVPAGLLILVSALMVEALVARFCPVGGWLMLMILGATSLLVGLLARWLRPFHGMGTAVTAGVMAAALLFLLGRRAGLGGENPIGPPGMVVVMAFSALGGWLPSKLRRR